MRKVYDSIGTLCSRCSHAMVISTTSGDLVHCGELNRFIKYTVRQCSRFRNVGDIPEWRLRNIAWIITPSTGSRPIGFVKPGTEEHRKLLGKDQPAIIEHIDELLGEG